MHDIILYTFLKSGNKNIFLLYNFFYTIIYNLKAF